MKLFSILTTTLLALLAMHAFVAHGDETIGKKIDSGVEQAKDAGRAMSNKAENVGEAVQPRLRRETVGERVDQGLDTVRGAGETVREKATQAGENVRDSVSQAGEDLKRKGENVKEAVQSRRRRDTVGEKVDQGLDTVRGAGETVKEKVNEAKEGVERKGENVGDAIKSRLRRAAEAVDAVF